MTRELVPYRGTTVDVAQASDWERMDKSERRRRIITACEHPHNHATLLHLFESWIVLHGKAGARVSPHTRSSYLYGARMLLEAFAQQNLRHPDDAAANGWIRRMEQDGLAPATVRVRKAAAAAFYKALRWSGATDADPFADVQPARDPVAPWDKRSPYEEDEVERVLASIAASEREHAHEANYKEQLWVALAVLLGAHVGLRCSEMCDLLWQDIRFAQRKLRVRHGKGGKAATIDMSTRLVEALEAYRAAHPGTTSVLPYRARSTVWVYLKRACVTAGVEFKGVHSLRHTAGTSIVASGLSLEDAAQQLRHSTIETSRSYAKWSNTRLKEFMDKR